MLIDSETLKHAILSIMPERSEVLLIVDNQPEGIVRCKDCRFGEEWGRWQGMLKEGCTIFIKAKCTPGKFNSNYYNFQISDIQYLQTVKEQRIEKITITIDSDSLDDTLVTDLATLIEDSPGNTQLYIQILDTETKRPITLRSRNRSINIQRDLINFIHSNEGMSYKIN